MEGPEVVWLDFTVTEWLDSAISDSNPEGVWVWSLEGPVIPSEEVTSWRCRDSELLASPIKSHEEHDEATLG